MKTAASATTMTTIRKERGILSTSQIPPDAPVIPGPAWRTATALAGTVRLQTFEAGRTGADAPTVVFLHGMGHWTQAAWNRLVPAFAATHRIVAFDLPGFGASAKPDAPYTLPFFTSALQDVVAAAGLGRFAIAGHSLGGLVAANYAAFYPGRVRALGLIAPAGFVRTPGLIARVAGACCLRPMRLALPAPGAFVRSGLRRAVHDPQVVPPGDVARACALARDPATARAFLGVYAGARHELARMRAIHERFARYRGPVAIVWGRDDRYITTRGLAAAQRVYPHADAALLADCGHCPHLEYPDLVARQLLAAGF